MRLISKLEEEGAYTTKCLKSKIYTTKRCTKEQCQTEITGSEADEHILRTTVIPNNTKISLQMVIDNFIPQLSTNRDQTCNKCGSECEETNTLMVPTPVIMVHINKANTDGKKTDTEIEINDEIMITTTDNPRGEKYKVSDVIIHHGSETTNGHYITTHYKEGVKRWEKVNDEKCAEISNKEAENINKHGVVYVMKRNHNTVIKNIDSHPTNQTYAQIATVKETSKQYHEQTKKQVVTKSTAEAATNKDESNIIRKKQDINRFMKEDDFTLVNRRRGGREVEKLWKMVPKENPWSSIPNLERYIEGSSKRCYLDRDDPSEKSKKICWWHQRGKCKFGKRCHYSHDLQPFLAGAQ